MMKRLLYIVVCTLLFTACQEGIVSDDASLRLVFSVDTLCFDTVFSNIGTSTRQVMLYNPNRNALRIRRVWMNDGQYFHVNMDGETDLSQLKDIELRGGDSLYIFVRAKLDTQDSNNPVLIEDQLNLQLAQAVQSLHLEAYGQDVRLIRSPKRRTDYTDNMTLDAEKPYLIYDTLFFHKNLTINPGVRLYMHSGASIYCTGRVVASGTLEAPILVQGDRLDNLFDNVPYSYAAGQWGGIFLIDDGQGLMAKSHTLNHIEIIGGNIGLYCYSERNDKLGTLKLHNSRLHNHALYGLAIFNTNAEVVNTEISNAASYCVYLSGGKQQFVHTTIADYFRHTNVNIQSAPRDTVATVYISDISKSGPRTEASFINSIITGITQRNLLIATPLPQYYTAEITGCLLACDTLSIPNQHDNVYYHKDDTAHIFANDYYKYQEWRYYDFRLDSLSPARGIGDSTLALPYPTDRLGHSRTLCRPDAGCYQYRVEG